jgi:hypothetical protein
MSIFRDSTDREGWVLILGSLFTWSFGLAIVVGIVAWVLG